MASLLSGLDLSLGGVPSSSVAVFGSIAMNGDEYVRCVRCSHGGCDLRVQGCGCTAHARCIALKPEGALSVCPLCSRPTTGLVLFPMSFREIDEARKTVAALASTGRRGRKRKNSDAGMVGDEKGLYISERRTGRWTPEEMAYCDKLIEKFETGELPLGDGIKLNDFLGNMLKSKQSRLTKKMKNAKLSSKTFERVTGSLTDTNQAREFSELEESFFHSIQCHQERAEVKFHMQKEWRDHFSSYCVAIGQPLDADSWLSSVEEMDRRASNAKDAARRARRKLMIGFALRTDVRNADSGIYIDKAEDEDIPAQDGEGDESVMGKETEDMLSLLTEKSMLPESSAKSAPDVSGDSSMLQSAPFLCKVLAYMQRHNVPFEHVDLWVPSFVSSNGEAVSDGSTSTCRLCHAGSATSDFKLGRDGKCSTPLSGEEKFNLQAFGDYSQKFSFDVGCGLPGRVYRTGLPTWEQSVQNAPHQHFERCGGALQWGIKTVVGIPIASPNVGRIVVTLYSRSDRDKDQELVGRLSEEFTRLMPSPKWKLVVDIGEIEPLPPAFVAANYGSKASTTSSSNGAVAGHVADSETSPQDFSTQTQAAPDTTETHTNEMISLLGECMPSDPSSPLASILPGFMSLRLLLLRPTRSAEENDVVRTMLGSYASYLAGGRAKNDIAVMLARDYMFLTQQQPTPPQQQPQSFLSLGQSASLMPSSSGASAPGYSFFGHNSTNQPSPNYHQSPVLTPIPLSGSNGADSLSIVSN